MLPYQTNETLLSICGVSKAYDIPILRDINLDIKNIVRPDVKQGQIVSLIGRSGSGKSTLFRIMAGLEKADKGSVLVLRDNIWAHVEEGNMGVVFQNSYVFPWRRVRSLLKAAVGRNVALHKLPSRDQDSYLAAIIDVLSIGDHLNKFTNQLSGGQRQRVAIAEQILNGGDFILMDEPFSGLDTLTIERVTTSLTKLALEDEKKTIVIVSHDLSNSLAISDTAFILAKQEGKEGATITHQVCLASQGLAWQPGIKENPLFRDLLNHIKTLL